eukprot:m.60644 g.60644  ORF g.60644 m.60644 type:complete len:630 (-) comp7956_c0_seq1:3861-5750(-)
MPWFTQREERSKSPKPQNKDEKKKYQKALWEAENSPSKQVDFSDCGLDSISSTMTSALGAKEALLANDNRIASISSSISNVKKLQILDVHNNIIKSLPLEMGKLVHLKILNVGENKLKEFPLCVLELAHLETLNLSHNHIKTLPKSMGKMQGIRTLNVSHNAISTLPPGLHELRCMDTLIITGNPIKHPAIDVESATTEQVMKALCKDAGMEYIAPSQFLLQKLRADKGDITVTEDDLLAQRKKEEENISKLLQQKKMGENKIEMLEAVRRKDEEELQENQKRLLQEERAKTNRLAREMEVEVSEMSDRVMQLQEEDRRRKEEMLARIAKLNEEEDDMARDVVAEWNKRKNDPALRQQLLESETQTQQQMIALSIAREASHQAAIQAMHDAAQQQKQFLDTHTLKLEEARQLAMQQFRAHQNALDDSIAGFMKDVEESRCRHGEVLLEEEKRHTQLLTGAAEESAKQREERVKEITSMNEQLERLSLQHQQYKLEKKEQEAIKLQEERDILEKQLKVLRSQQQERENQLMHTIMTLDENDKKNYRAYWEAKLSYAMQHVLEGDIPCDSVVKSVLASVNLSHLEPLFARNHVDAVVLRVLGNSDLEAMGISALGDRKKVLLGIQSLFSEQ